MTGPYCAQCGEAALDPSARTVRHFISNALLDEIVHFDSKFWRTLRLLFTKPGRLSEEYIAGRRKPYIGPVKLLLAAIFVFAVVTRGGFAATLMLGPIVLNIAPAAPPQGATIRESVFFVDRFGVLDRALTLRIGPGDGGTATAQFHDRLRSLVQPLSFGNVFFLALALWLMFRSRVPLFVDHLVFSMHTVSFVLVSTLLLAPAFLWEDAFGSLAWILVLGVGIWQFGYLTTAIGRYVRVRRLRAFSIAVLLYLLNGIFVSAVQMFGGWLAISEL